MHSSSVHLNAHEVIKKAFLDTKNQLVKIKEKQIGTAFFLDAHILLAQDPSLIKEVLEVVDDLKCGPDIAVSKVFNKYIDIMKSSKDPYLHDRYLDFLDVKSRVISNLSSQTISLKNLGDCILIVHELYPSYLIDISSNVKGIIASKGGYTSHSAIVCRQLGIPYVICELPLNFEGDILIHDEEVILNPSKDLKTKYLKQENEEALLEGDLKDISVWANVSKNSDIDLICGDTSKYFKGVGLYRTEFILMNSLYLFDEQAQAEIYLEALEKAHGRPVVFRTFDLGDDKKIEVLINAKKGVENYYIYPKVFLTQIKALLIASNKYPNQVKIMFPMIERVSEYNDLKKQIVKIARSMNVKIPPIGMMVETQQAILHLNDFSKVDFMSVGTNDLCKEVFNLSRDSALIYDNIYEELLEIIKRLISFSNEHQIKLSICGELIAKPDFARRAFALGLKNASISPVNLKYIFEALKCEEVN